MSRTGTLILGFLLLVLCGCSANGPVRGEDWLVTHLAMRLKWIPPGECEMGAAPGEVAWAEGPGGQGHSGWFPNEARERAVFRKGFWLGQTEVTVGQWRTFVEETGYETDAEKAGFAWGYDWKTTTMDNVPGACWHNPTYGMELADNHPVSCVSWNDAVAFCRWLTDREKAAGRLSWRLEYRLPGEAEWEYACRAGSGPARFWWGDDPVDGAGRLNAASDDIVNPAQPERRWNNPFSWSDGYGFISPVDAYGERGRNAFGLADMLGNLWEWCYDTYDPVSAHPRIFLKGHKLRLIRGGAFDDRPAFVRSAVRQAPAPGEANFARGFRVCLGPVP